MPFAYIFQEVWRWFADTGINLVLLVLMALLVPRAGRFTKRVLGRRVRESADPNEGKSQLAVAGVGVYIIQLIAYFLIFIFILQQLGFSLAGAAIPATVASAAIGFGAQSIIADFLAGFFILTEKQYGVGDNVTFKGNGLDINGDVIQITMRATQIRTLNQATVTVPNSAARIYINQSNYWVNALVVMPVPLDGSESAEHAIERAERATRRAISRPEIHEKVIGELQVHPAVEVNPPTAAGLPWTVDMRFMVRVEPLSQWMVERAIRIAILDEFWEEYGRPPGLFPLADASKQTTPLPAAPGIDPEAYPPTERMEPVVAKPKPADDPAVETEGVADTAEDAETDEQAPKTVFDGLMRVSTMWLLVAFGVALLVRGMTLDPDSESANAGVLAPPPRTAVTTTAEETSVGTRPAPVPESATSPEPSPQPTPRSENTATSEPTPTTTGETTTATSTESKTATQNLDPVRGRERLD